VSKVETEVTIVVGGVEFSRFCTVEYSKIGALAALESLVIQTDDGHGADILEVFVQEELEQIAEDLGITGSEDDNEEVEDRCNKESS